MLIANIKIAMASLRATKGRSFLTMLGVIIGIVSVITTVSIGEGVKRQVGGQINELGSDLLTVFPGRLVTRDDGGSISGVNVFNFIGRSGTLSERDWKAVESTEGVEVAVPISLVTGAPRTEDRQFEEGVVVATTEEIKKILEDKIHFGEFPSASDSSNNSVVVGKRVAEQLMQENIPVGKSLQIRDKSFRILGVLEAFETSPLSFDTNFNVAVVIPYEVGKELNGGQSQIYQILVKPAEDQNTRELASRIQDSLSESRGDYADFTVLRQEENMALANNLLSLLTNLIAGIAAISLVVGGIGIMNIMLVSVTERTHEIGIRKAVGATNRQIYSQFITEATVLSLAGGVAGVLVAVLINYLLRIFTDLQPVITVPVVLLATGVATAVGIVFGFMPALRAARKDPIEALRHE